MVTICWAAKGGSGTSVVAAGLALSRPEPSLLVDLRGDLPAILGLADPERPGVADWLATDMPGDNLADLLVELAVDRWLLPFGGRRHDGAPDTPTFTPDRWRALGDWLSAWAADAATVVIDAGTGTPPADLVAAADRALLVMRPCYLALRSAARDPTRATGVILVDEPGHTYRRRDVESAVGVRVEATVGFDPAVAQAVDAGLLLSRLPRSLECLKEVAA